MSLNRNATFFKVSAHIWDELKASKDSFDHYNLIHNQHENQIFTLQQTKQKYLTKLHSANSHLSIEDKTIYQSAIKAIDKNLEKIKKEFDLDKSLQKIQLFKDQIILLKKQIMGAEFKQDIKMLDIDMISKKV